MQAVDEKKIIDQTIEQKYKGRRQIRKEDIRLLTGKGEYAGDVRLPGMLHVAILRSAYGHANIKGIDISAAKALPGVIDVVVGADVKGKLWVPNVYEIPNQLKSDDSVLATDKVWHAGQPIAAVVAENRYVAEDALELIEVDYEPLPAVTTMEDALKPDAPKLYEDWENNICVEWTATGGDVAKAFDEADVVVADTVKMHRHMPSPLEGRVVVADVTWDGDLTIWCSHQGPYRIWYETSAMLGIPENKVKVIAADVGGAFGGKFTYFPEEFLIPWLAIRLQRPVKWEEDRKEHFLGDTHAREQTISGEIAAKNDGTILGFRGKIFHDQGFSMRGISCATGVVAAYAVDGPYAGVVQQMDGAGVVTNKAPQGAYRGFGEENGNLFREVMVDNLAKELGMDPLDIRMKNFITTFPYPTPVYHSWDSGDYPETLRLAKEALGYDEWRKKQEKARAEGKLLGIGTGFMLLISGWAPSWYTWLVGCKCGGYVSGRIRLEPDGTASVYTAMSISGQGIETMLAQVAADELGIPLDDVRVIYSSSPECGPSGYQTGGSRGAPLGGSAVAMAARKLKDKMMDIAAKKLEVDRSDIEYAANYHNGRIVVKGDESRGMTFKEIVKAAYDAKGLPEGTEPGLDASAVFDPADLCWTSGSHLAVVEVDPETFKTEILDYVISLDCGVVINPGIVEGQSIGGLSQVIGGMFSEELIYDEAGQLLTTTFTDYPLPRASDMPRTIKMTGNCSPTPRNVLGAKGMGEGAMTGAYMCVASAVKDALQPLGYNLNEYPLSPSKLFERVKKIQATK